ncbi:hypothetical protein [Paenibacillus turpanensis]|uniref:hypothetical protein n=1 Tax=Paenibacillus turpanensis TaxID=2689078 RepID=UPI00140BCA06|nr:hypothetical protein [Paenibacillus turpanensis]
MLLVLGIFVYVYLFIFVWVVETLLEAAVHWQTWEGVVSSLLDAGNPIHAFLIDGRFWPAFLIATAAVIPCTLWVDSTLEERARQLSESTDETFKKP